VAEPSPPTSPVPGLRTAGPDNLGRAMAWMVLSGLSFAMMGATVKFSAGSGLPAQVFFRNLVTLAITTGFAIRMRENPLSCTPNWPRLLLRSVSGLGGVALYFVALSRLNLADASLLNKTSPFFVTLFATLLLKEKLNRGLVPALIMAFVGALLIIKPRFDLSALPAVAGFLSGMCAGLAYTLVRSLKGRESPNRIIFVFSLVSTVAAAPFMAAFPPRPTPDQWLALLGTGIFAAGGQYGLTFAYHHAPAARISIFTYLHVLFSMVLGFLFWQEKPDLASLLGGVLIIAAAVKTHRNQ
jgi:drug/metabolite transporter (DMT)-like permease